MDDESGYEGGSEATPPSLESEISLSDYKRKKPCEICGSNANEEKLITCYFCKVTREHTYCMRVLKQFVPYVWACDECLIPAVRANHQVVDSIDQTATSVASASQAVDNEDPTDQATNSKTNQVVDNEVVHHDMSTSDSCDQFSATHQSSSHAHTSPVGVEGASSHVPIDASLVKMQKLPDSNLPSDSESAN